MGYKIQRWSSKEKKVVSVPCPKMIHQYNKHMGEVGLCDMLMSLYRIELGSKKWCTHIVYYCIGVAVTNSWMLYKRHCSQNVITQHSKLLALLDFQARIADSLLHQKKQLFVQVLELIVQFWWKADNQQIILKSHLTMLVIFLSDDDIAEGTLPQSWPKYLKIR